MELSQTTLIMVHKLTTPVTLDIVFMETDIAPVSRMMEAGLGQSQLVLTKVSCVFVLLIVHARSGNMVLQCALNIRTPSNSRYTAVVSVLVPL